MNELPVGNVIEQEEELLPVEEGSDPELHGEASKRLKKVQYEGFDGLYRKIEELRPNLPAFRDYYLAHRVKEDGTKTPLKTIVDEFNLTLPENEREFWPDVKMFRQWRKKWDVEISERFNNPAMKKQALVALQDFRIRNIVMVPKKEDGKVVEMADLEIGAMGLGEMLVNDAATTLKDTQENEQMFDDEVVVKRKQYALNVFAYVTRSAAKKAEIDIKRSANAREQAGFMLDLIRRAAAGNMTEEEMAMLRGSVSARQPETQGV